MASPTLVSVDEYLHTVYRPDCDYVDGEILERNLGEYKHSMIQAPILERLFAWAHTLPIRVLPELRMRVSATRFRVPDICVMLKSQPVEPVLSRPPFLCVEILSSEDRMSRTLQRVHEYLAFGVPNVWVIDPQTRTAYSYTTEGARQVRDQLVTKKPDISIALPELFALLADAVDEAS